jgi:hypothetical protein
MAERDASTKGNFDHSFLPIFQFRNDQSVDAIKHIAPGQ